MSDEMPAAAAPIVKRGPGRPRKQVEAKVEPKVESKAKFQMKARPNWVTMDPDDGDTPDRLRIAPELVPEGFDMLWVTSEVFGQPDPQHRSEFERKGWTPVHQEDFGGRFNGMFMKRDDPNEINVRGLVLMARPKELSIRARKADERRAREQVAIKEAALRYGELPVTLDARHPSAVNTNRINKSYERIIVPED